MTTAKAKAKANPTNPVYTLDVELISGPTTWAFREKNPQVKRRIQILGKQTLADLHDIIFKAFDRDDFHLYEFQMGGRKPRDRKARIYGHDDPEEWDADDEAWMQEDIAKDESRRPMLERMKALDIERCAAGNVHDTAMSAVGLTVRKVFYYWFDYGDDWWHKIKVVKIDDSATSVKYPQITERIGASPPQFWSDEEGHD